MKTQSWGPLVFPALFFTVTAWALGWLWAFFAFNTYGPVANANGFGSEPRLPRCLSYYQTPDNSLLGDGAWQRCEPAHWAWRTGFAWFPLLYRYLGRVGWIMRNPAQGYDTLICAHISPDCRVEASPDSVLTVQDKPKYQPGVLRITATNPDGSSYWARYSVSRSFAGFCWLTKFGWELKTYLDNGERIKTQPTARFMLSARPSGIN